MIVIRQGLPSYFFGPGWALGSKPAADTIKKSLFIKLPLQSIDYHG